MVRRLASRWVSDSTTCYYSAGGSDSAGSLHLKCTPTITTSTSAAAAAVAD